MTPAKLQLLLDTHVDMTAPSDSKHRKRTAAKRAVSDPAAELAALQSIPVV